MATLVLHDAARLLLPSDPAITATVVDGQRSIDADADADVDVVVWYWAPTSGGGPVTGLRRGGRRELELFRMRFGGGRGLRVVRAHRLPPPLLGIGAGRHRGRGAVLGGAVVELSRTGSYDRVVDAAAAAAGSDSAVAGISFGSGGSALAPVTLGRDTAVLRIGLTGSPGDPGGAVAGLRSVADAQLPQIPRLLGAGSVGSASWTAEVALPGSRPQIVGPSLINDIITILGQLPRNTGSPTSLIDDVSVIATAVPTRASTVARLLERVHGDLARVPAVTRHGDLWSGNLLVEDDRLSGVVDWDAWHPASVPGTDLLQLLVTDGRHRAARSLGEAWVQRPWDDERVAVVLRRHLHQVGVEPTADVVELVALAWWATEVAGTLRRAPNLGSDSTWLARNVDPVLTT